MRGWTMDRRSRTANCACNIAGMGIGAAIDWTTARSRSFSRKRRRPRYESARYAMLRVAEDGSTVLTDLAGEDRVAIKPSAD